MDVEPSARNESQSWETDVSVLMFAIGISWVRVLSWAAVGSWVFALLHSLRVWFFPTFPRRSLWRNCFVRGGVSGVGIGCVGCFVILDVNELVGVCNMLQKLIVCIWSDWRCDSACAGGRVLDVGVDWSRALVLKQEHHHRALCHWIIVLKCRVSGLWEAWHAAKDQHDSVVDPARTVCKFVLRKHCECAIVE